MIRYQHAPATGWQRRGTRGRIHRNHREFPPARRQAQSRRRSFLDRSFKHIVGCDLTFLGNIVIRSVFIQSLGLVTKTAIT